MANSGQTESAPSAKQLVFLAMVATAVAVIVFLCGVLVGRGVPLRRGGVAGALEALPRGGPPPPPPPPPPPGPRLGSACQNSRQTQTVLPILYWTD